MHERAHLNVPDLQRIVDVLDLQARPSSVTHKLERLLEEGASGQPGASWSGSARLCDEFSHLDDFAQPVLDICGQRR